MHDDVTGLRLVPVYWGLLRSLPAPVTPVVAALPSTRRDA